MKKQKIDFSKLIDNPSWSEAVIVYKQSNLKKTYTEQQRSYLIKNGQWGLDSTKLGRCIVGSCLDGTDPYLRLDAQSWKIEYCYILK